MASSVLPSVDVSTEQTLPREENIYWQIGKSASESIIELYNINLWTDVSFRSAEHETENPDDILRAHKLILAARSPVFSAMFYGSASKGNDTLQVLQYSKESIDAFLRCIYGGSLESLKMNTVKDVFRMAHFYQVTTVVEDCVDFISKNISVENACPLLEMAFLYEQANLKESLLAFIDNNARAVLRSESFLTVSRDTLEYILRGDTLYTEEHIIVKAAIKWAKTKLVSSNIDVNGDSIRNSLGGAFYYLRMTTMDICNFIKTERRLKMHTYPESLAIVSCITRSKPKAVPCHFANKRVPKVIKVSFTKQRADYAVHPKIINTQMKLETSEDLIISCIDVYIPALFENSVINYNAKPTQRIIVSCEDQAFEQSKLIEQIGDTSYSMRLNPPLTLCGTINRNYTLKVEISIPSAKSSLKFKTQLFSIKPYDSILSVKGKNYSVVCMMISRPSKREINASCEKLSDETKDSETESESDIGTGSDTGSELDSSSE